MKSAIIILNYNDSDNTIKLVNNIKSYNVIDKILIVDNNSSKENEFEVLKKIEDKKIEVIKTDKNGGYAYGNNFGLKYLDNVYQGEYKYVIISNPDIYVDEKSISYCINNLEKNRDVAICAPRMYYITGPARRAAWKKRTFLIDIANSTRLLQFLLYPIFKSGEYSKKEFENNILEVDNIAGSFFVANFEVFKKIGYFDESTFLFFEEDIIGDKLKKEGYKIHLLNNINFIHYESQTIGKVMGVLKKINILFNSKKYYHKKYNNIGFFGCLFIDFLRIIRCIELIFEIPIKKFFG